MNPWRLRRSLAAIGLAAALAAGVPRGAAAQTGVPCGPLGECCAARPSYSDLAYASFTGNVVVATKEPTSGVCVTIFDLTQPYPGDGVDYAAVQRYTGPGGSWNTTNLGTVFGTTIDKYGNIYVGQTTAYNVDMIGPGGAGAVYRIANGTGAITTFVTLPNASGAGLGNLSYDCEHDQLFVTNHEDGTIYRVKAVSPNAATGSILETFDPLGTDDGTTGFAPLGERLWGVQWHAGRVYYAVWSENCNETAGPPNSIRSVALTGAGAFVPISDQLELVMPPFGTTGYSHPVADISFAPDGSMLLAERSMSAPSFPAAHESRLLEYCGGGPWNPGGTYVVGIPATCCCSGQAGNGSNSAGGVDVDFDVYTPGTPFGRVWNTADAINFSLTEYGIQGLPPGGGIPANSTWLDMDGNTSYSEKTSLGDVEVPCPDLATATTMALFTVEPAGAALAVRWKFAESHEVADVALERSSFATGPWEVAGADLRSEAGITVATDRDVEAGREYFYRLVVGTTLGERLVFGPVSGAAAGRVAEFAILQKSPTPASGPVELEYAVPRASRVRVSVIDVQGRELAVLAEGRHEPGRYTVTWRPAGASRGGVYFVRYQTPAGNFRQRVVVTP